MNKVNMKGKNDLALDPAVSFIIFATNMYVISVINCILEGIKDFFLVPKNNKDKISIELIVIKRLALVKETFIPFKLISGPIL